MPVSVAIADLPPKPNIVLILLDDLGRGDLGAYGGTAIQTPNADLLAGQGMRFDEHYAMAPNCSPSRVGLLTGRFPAALGVRDLLAAGSTARGIPADVTTLPDVLKQEGYVTGHFGKWHIGSAYPEYNVSARFDHWVKNSFNSYIDPELDVNGTLITVTGHRTEILTDYAIDFITDNQAGPFFVNLWYLAPHTPHEPPAAWAAQYPDTNEGKYSALVSTVDEQVGRILATLNTLGLDDDTLVIVTSDNGTSFGSNSPFSGDKGQLYEGGIRAPLIARWTGAIPPGSTNDSLSAHIDLFATIADHLSVDTSGMNLHGESILDALLYDTELARSTPLVWEHQQQFAVRSGSSKLHQKTNVTDPDPAWTPTLTDLSTDITESIDLAASQPAVVDSLLDVYRSWRLQMGPIPFSVAAQEGAASVVGELMSFSGAGGRVVLANSARFDTHDGEFSFHAKVTTNAIGAKQMVAQHPGAWDLAILPDGKLEVRSYLELGGLHSVQTSAAPLQVGVSHDVAFTYRPGESNLHTRRLYVNGFLEAERTQGGAVISSSSPIYLGNSALSDAPLLGSVDALKLYSMALNLREIGADADADGIENLDDNCPSTPNGVAETGIPGVGNQTDLDADGQGDACDLDDDNDWLDDAVETDTGVYVSAENTGTAPTDPDTDGDLFVDGIEVQYGADPTEPASNPVVGIAYTTTAPFEAALGAKAAEDLEDWGANSFVSGVTVYDIGGLGVSLTFPDSVENVHGGPGETLDLKVLATTSSTFTTSGDRFLGIDNVSSGHRFVAGSEVIFDFPVPISGFGVQLVSSSVPGVDLMDQDVELRIPGYGATALTLADGVTLGTAANKTYTAYFLAFISDFTFQTATLGYAPTVSDGDFRFFLDDLTLVPEPASPLALAAGVALLLVAARRRSKRV